MYSSLSGGESVGNGAGKETFVEGLVTLCSWASTVCCSLPAEAVVENEADFSASLDREL